MPMIHIDHFSARLGSFQLNDISLRVEEQEIFAILGKTGAGKTVLLESIAGFHSGQKGAIYLQGNNVMHTKPEQQKIGFVYQDYALFPHMSVLDNITYGLKMQKVSKQCARGTAESMAVKLGINHLLHRFPACLSGGEQQRVALARALVLNPKLLLMDEPFAALDPKTKEQMYELIEQIHREFACTIIFVTHDFAEAQRMAKRIGIMIDGELRAVCSSDELFHNHNDRDIRNFLL